MKNLLLTCLLLLLSSFFLSAQNTYIAPVSGDLIIEDCSGILYDSGGTTADYTNGELSTIRLTGASGDALALTFTEFDVESNFDFLFIYAGSDTNSPLVGNYSGNDLPNNGDPIFVSGLNCTLVFQSDFSVTRAGFELGFECVDFTDPPVAVAAFPAFNCTGTVAFSDASTLFPTSWTWDFGDGNTSTEQNPVHTYASPGTYDIELTVCNDNGCNTSLATQALTFDPESFACTNGFNMTYQETETTSLCNGVLFDNGGPDGNYLEGSNDQFIIAPPGATSITLTFLSFDLGSLTNNHDQLYIFDVNGSVFSPLATYVGNELPANGQPITFDVSALGIYFSSDHFNNFPGFQLIWESNGSSNPPVAAISAEATTVPFGTNVQFTDLSTENPGGWVWDFGDGTTSNEQNPTHIYTQSGTFEVTLSVTNCNGSDTSLPLTITVQESPTISANPASFSVALEAGTSGTELLNLCNIGLGDLFSNLLTLDNAPQAGYQFEFTTTAAGANTSWQVLNQDFEVIAGNSEVYAANSTYTEVVTGLDAGTEYYFTVNNENSGEDLLENIVVTDLGTGALLFSGFFQLIPGEFYFLPPPSEGSSAQIAWLDIAENNNPLAPNACEDILLTFDATNLVAGIYEGTIFITSNDPDNPLLTIPVTLTVTGTPVLAISANNLNFGEVQVGGSASLSFELENTGTADLSISGLLSSNPNFTVQSSDEVLLAPYQSRNITVVFSPDAIADFSETLTLVNNAGEDVLVNLTGTGIAAPSLTINPTDFTIELIAGQDTTLNVDLGNVGEAILNYDISAFSNSTGFVFNFTTDAWGSEFSWNLLNSSGEVVQSSAGELYASNTDYSIELSGLSAAETYTLQLLDSFGDGALPAYSVVDALSGQVINAGDFVGQVAELVVAIGSPATEFSSITPSSGTVETGGNNQLSIAVDATGLSTGVYFLNFLVNTNDPLQPTATITVTLYVIAPVEAAIAAQTFVCGNLPVQFTDESTNVPTSWTWDFGDGTTSMAQNPTHTYLENGSYTISLVACNSLGCDTVELVDYIEVDVDCYTQNIPEHGNEIITVCEGVLYDSGGPTADYLEGSFGSLTIAPPGAMSVSITFSEFNFEEHADFLYVYDGEPGTGTLLGTFTGTELAGQTLTAESGVLTIQEYTGHFVNLSGFAATFSCMSDPQPAMPGFSISNDLLCNKEPVVFFDESTSFPTSWFWEFGDGATSNEQNPFHLYDASGTYTVTLTVCNDNGCNTLIQDITITIDLNCLVEDIPVDGQRVIVGCAGTIYDSGGADGDYLNNSNGAITIVSTAGPITLDFEEFDYEFSFDGLIIIDGDSPSDPVLAIFDGNTIPESVTSTGTSITIMENTDFSVVGSGFVINYSCEGVGPLLRGLLVNNETICDGKRSFAVDTDTEIDSWSWDFGDGHTANGPNPEHEFAQSGAYEISLLACAGNDCQSIQTMIYSNKLTPEISAPEVVAIGQEVQLHGLTEAATHWNWDFGNGQTSDHNAPTTAYQEAGWHDIHVHLINMNVHETCDATHTHPIYVDANLTSVDEAELVSFSVYPNPTTGQINLKGLTELTGDYQIRVLNAMGQVVKTMPLSRTISIAAFPAGMYLLEVIDGQRIVGRSRVVKE